MIRPSRVPHSLALWALLLPLGVGCRSQSGASTSGVDASAALALDPPFTDSVIRIAIRGSDGSAPGDVLFVGQSSRLLWSVHAVGRAPDGEYRGLAHPVPGARLSWRSLTPDIVATDSVGRIEARRPGLGAVEATAILAPSEPGGQTAIHDTMPLRVLPADPMLSTLRVTEVSSPATSDAYQTCVVTLRGQVVCLRPTAPRSADDDGGGEDSAPIAVFSPPSGSRFRGLVTGIQHVCALTDGGRSYCWGDNQWGQLGDGGDRPAANPTPVSTPHSFRKLSAGRSHTCGITTSNEVFCWGLGTNDALGPAGVDRCIILVESQPHRPQPQPTSCARTPQPVPLPDPVLDVAVGDDHSCGLTTQHQLFCWGWVYNVDFRSRRPKRVDDGGARLVSLSSGSRHVCGLDAAGRAFCWGRNWYGQLGADAPREGSAELVAVLDAVVFRTIAPGDEHTCAIARDGRALCWGRGTSGQLGSVIPLRDLARPAVVRSTISWSDIAAGHNHTCAATDNGALYCWGSGLGFRSAPSSYHEQPEPFLVAGWQ